jgi:Nucleotidyl transferase AbiEii toxin, Type IV TA system
MPKEPRLYFSANAFRIALETRLNQTSKESSIDVQRLRRQVSFDRLLARIFSGNENSWLLKGGYALELRLPIARTTKDVDLSLITRRLEPNTEQSTLILEMLREAVSIDLKDYFVFDVGMPTIDVNAPYGGARFPVTTNIADRLFIQFHIDIGLGDVVIEPADSLAPRDFLSFAGITSAPYRTISKEQHFAEKLHAYTVPRESENSRVRDLVDMLLLINSGLNQERLKDAIKRTFDRRKTHLAPKGLPMPPISWKKVFDQLANECKIDQTIEEGYTFVKEYLLKLS